MTDLIADFEKHLRRQRRATATIRTYVETLRRMDRELDAGLATALPEELEAWLLDNQWAAATQRLRRSAVVAFFDFACDPKRRVRVDWNPAEELPKIAAPRRYPRPTATGVVQDALARGGMPYRLWFTMAAYAGARCIEVASADREDIGSETTLLHGKGSKTRRVPTHRLLWEAARTLPPGPVAVACDGQRMTREEISRLGNKRLGQLGHDGVTMHMLRHWFGTQAYQACGHDIRAVQELLGHASVSTTQIYVAASIEGMNKAVAGLPTTA